jgi:hypothetical protein
VKQDDMFSTNVDDLEDCTCRMGTVFGGDYWDAPPTTSPEDCEAHRNDVLQRRPTRASLNFALDMERFRLARLARAPEDARSREEDRLKLDRLLSQATRCPPMSHAEVIARIDMAAFKARYPKTDAHFVSYEGIHAVSPIPEGGAR